ncbi:AraC family transcriptional regulator [Aliifodinibius sp. S!AR15-10]|uniref:helix-turn-helix domain-containing protein n=1 Tax=Aliifodinibius sp. S!AR15-10 TaxID=2950437 RepID=UPI0028607276|nr:AraC family transcriptional regulator [Aliifodinibius sp. S!AR15-10]MDR8392570.1 AraC family transcriptional regulator [Aliifodinibius sp. S!AR15-10]
MQSINEIYFQKEEDPSLEFEIIPLEDFFVQHSNLAQKPHQLSFYQLIFITSGEGEHEIDFQRLTYKPGTLIPAAVHQVQKFYPDPNTTGYMLLFTPHFLLDELKSVPLYSELLIFSSLISPVTINGSPSESSVLSDIVYRIHQDYTIQSDVIEEEILRSELKILLLKAEQIKRRQSSIENNVAFALLSDFRKEIENHIEERPSVQTCCRRMGVSEKRLNSELKEYTGKTAKEIIDERITLEIKRLLSYTDKYVKEIAYHLGFNDPSNLTTFFKKHTDSTPKEFRESYRH